MAQPHILNYDGEFVTFYYVRYEDGKKIEETVHVFDFIKKLIIQIHSEHFKVTHYYGIYVKKHKHSSKIFKTLSQAQIEITQQLLSCHLVMLLLNVLVVIL